MESARHPRRAGITPMGLAMIICDSMWQDPATLKHFILGIFHSIDAGELPCSFPRIMVYFVLTGGRGNIPVTVRIVDSAGEIEIYSAPYGDIEFTTPLMVAERAIVLTDVVFPVEDEYRVQLVAANEVVLERRLLVTGVEDDEERFDS